MSSQETHEAIEARFLRLGGIDEKVAQGHYTPKEWGALRQEYVKRAVKTFKRKVLGLCGGDVVKNLDEMAILFYKNGMATSLDDGRHLAPLIVGNTFIYANDLIDPGIWKELRFEEVTNPATSEKKYRIQVYSVSLGL